MLKLGLTMAASTRGHRFAVLNPRPSSSSSLRWIPYTMSPLLTPDARTTRSMASGRDLGLVLAVCRPVPTNVWRKLGTTATCSRTRSRDQKLARVCTPLAEMDADQKTGRTTTLTRQLLHLLLIPLPSPRWTTRTSTHSSWTLSAIGPEPKMLASQMEAPSPSSATRRTTKQHKSPCS